MTAAFASAAQIASHFYFDEAPYHGTVEQKMTVHLVKYCARDLLSLRQRRGQTQIGAAAAGGNPCHKVPDGAQTVRPVRCRAPRFRSWPLEDVMNPLAEQGRGVVPPIPLCQGGQPSSSAAWSAASDRHGVGSGRWTTCSAPHRACHGAVRSARPGAALASLIISARRASARRVLSRPLRLPGRHLGADLLGLAGGAVVQPRSVAALWRLYPSWDVNSLLPQLAGRVGARSSARRLDCPAGPSGAFFQSRVDLFSPDPLNPPRTRTMRSWNHPRNEDAMARLPKVDQPYTQDRATISEFIDTYEDDLLGFLAQRAALNDPKQLMTKRRREASAKLIDVEAIGAVLKVKHDSSKTHERKLEFWRQVLIALGIVFPDLHDDLFADHRDAPQENAVRKAAAAA